MRRDSMSLTLHVESINYIVTELLTLQRNNGINRYNNISLPWISVFLFKLKTGHLLSMTPITTR